MAVGDTSRSGVAEGLYAPDKSASLYAEMAELAASLLREGEDVIVDAACLSRSRRAVLVEAAQAVGAQHTIVHLTADRAVLEARLAQRQAAGDDPSEADAEVLAWQLVNGEQPSADEAITLDTGQLTLDELLAALAS